MRKYLLFLPLAILFACSEAEPDDLAPTPTIDGAAITTEFELGRVLFYDKKLSINNSVSCGTCHKQAFAFADNVALSPGFENRTGNRNTMPIQNLGFNNGFMFPDFDENGNLTNFFGSLFWDGRESSLQDLILQPVANHREMGMSDLDKLVEKLNSVEYYRTAFRNVYFDEQVTLHGISSSMTQFISEITSSETKLDQFQNGRGTLNATELRGRALFNDTYDCNSCHQVQNTSDYLFAGGFTNIGLEQEYADSGLGTVTGNASDNGRFKTPSLRNVALTGPYMHDGRFETLDDVLDHYSEGIAQNENLDFRLKAADGSAKSFNISPEDKRAIIAFLHTLTDFQMISNPAFSDPFRK